MQVRVDRDGTHRCLLTGVPEAETEVFASALEEAVSPLASPRYLVPRPHLDPEATGLARRWAAARGRVGPDGVVWHAVPAAAGRNKALASAYAGGWGRWMGGRQALRVGTPEGAGVLAAQSGVEPLAVAAVIRNRWS